MTWLVDLVRATVGSFLITDPTRRVIAVMHGMSEVFRVPVNKGR
jgi:hypothetical protein